jgi:hypothetical protein
MDLFLSSQSLVFLGLLAAGSMTLCWLVGRLRARRRASAARVEGSARLHDLQAGAPAALTGILRVEGPMCSRFEDAHPVAVTSYQQPPGLRAEEALLRTWHERAARIYLEVGDRRVALEGALVVARGSNEWTPGAGLEGLRDRVRDRVYAAEVLARARRRGDDREHVFRSLEPGDEVVVRGIAERKVDADGPTSYRHHGGGWRLLPEGDGAIVAHYCGRPDLRAQLGRAPLYAAAGSVAMALLLASFAAGTQPACSDRREACALYGWCGTRLEQQGAELSVACVPSSSEDCARSLLCRKSGACTAAPWGECIATRDDDCRDSLACQIHGRCSAGPGGECLAASLADCMRAAQCREGCRLFMGECLPQDDDAPL